MHIMPTSLTPQFGLCILSGLFQVMLTKQLIIKWPHWRWRLVQFIDNGLQNFLIDKGLDFSTSHDFGNQNGTTLDKCALDKERTQATKNCWLPQDSYPQSSASLTYEDTSVN